MLEAEAKQRQGTRADIGAKLHEGSRSDANAGKALGVSGRMVSDAKAIKVWGRLAAPLYQPCFFAADLPRLEAFGLFSA